MLVAIAASEIWPGALDVTSVLFGILSTLTIVGVVSRIALGRHVKPEGWVLGDRAIVLTDQGLVDAGNGTELKVDWPAIDGVTVSKNLVVLWIEPAPPGCSFRARRLPRPMTSGASSTLRKRAVAVSRVERNPPLLFPRR